MNVRPFCSAEPDNAAALSALLALGLAPTASAGGGEDTPTTATAITSPGDPYFSLVDDRGSAKDSDSDDDSIAEPNELTITGTADNQKDLRIVCLYGDGAGDQDYNSIGYVNSDELGGSGTAWTSVLVDKDDFPCGRACQLRAVPSSASYDYDDLKKFSGPRVGMGYHWDDSNTTVDRAARAREHHSKVLNRNYSTRSHNDELLQGYEVTATQLRGYFDHMNTSWCGLCSASPFKVGSFARPSDDSWWYGPSVWGPWWGWFEDQSMISIDGHPAFDPGSVPTNLYDAESGSYADLPGRPELKYSIVSHNANTGDMVIREAAPYVRCDTADGKPLDVDDMTLQTCPRMVSTGVRMVRTITQDHDGLLASYVDSWESTDGAAHGLHAEYDAGVDAYSDEYVWKLPGTTSYERYYDQVDEVEFPQSPVGSFYGRPDSGCFDCRTISDGRGAPVSLTYTNRPDRALFYGDGFYLSYDRLIPAGGSEKIGLAMGHELSSEAVEKLGAEVEDRATVPQVAITSPTNGSSVSQSRISVTGTAGEDTGVLKVNGKPVAVTGDGTWATDLDLAEGENTITAVATDRVGQSVQDERLVTYTKPAEPQPQVIVQQQIQQVPVQQQEQSRSRAGKGVGAVNVASKKVRLKGRRIRMSVRCAPGEPQNGTIKLRTNTGEKSRNRTLDTEVFQCPGGGKRSVSFLLSKRQVKQLRRKKSQKLTAFIVGRDLAGDAGVFRYAMTLRTR